jgi:hypothetical protein
MTTDHRTLALTSPPATPHPGGAGRVTESGYQPGVCNIGPEEIARRRRAGHVGLVATAAVLALLIALGAPPLARLVLFLPAAGAAIGYLQARFRFCAGFASRGVYNFGALGRTSSVDDPTAAARDRSMALRLALASAAIGAVVAIVTVLLPL